MANRITPASTPRSHSLRFVHLGLILSVGALLTFDLPSAAGAPSYSPSGETSISFVPSVQSDQDVRLLEPGKPIERELAGDQAHSYQIALAAGQYLRVVVDQRGIDVVVTLFGPDSKQIIEVDGPDGAQGPESVSVIAEVSGSYRLEVRSLEKMAAGRYEARVEELRAATGRDRIRLTAERALAEGDRLQGQTTTELRRKAVSKFEEALPLWRALSDRQKEAFTLRRIGQVYGNSLSEPQKALEAYRSALALFQAIGDRAQETATTTEIGNTYHALGDAQKALDFLGRALVLNRGLGDRPEEYKNLTTIGLVYRSLGDHQRALEYYALALPLVRSIGDKDEEARTLHSMGLSYSDLGDYRRALERYQEALSIVQATGNRRGLSYTLNSIGIAYRHLGDSRKALDVYEQVLALMRDRGDRNGEAYSLNNIGTVYHDLKEEQKALDYYTQALERMQATGDRKGESITLINLARVYRSLGKPDEARIQCERSLSLTESLRAGVISQELRSSFLASVQDRYELYIELLMQLHRQSPNERRDAEALQASERARARSLLELLVEARADIRQSVDPALLERERNLQSQLDAKAAARTALLSRKHTEEQAAAAEKEIVALTTQFQEVEARIRAASPRYAALTQPQPLNVAEIQQLLDPDTLLLEYALGDEHSYLWAVTPHSITGYQLPPRAEIEAAAKPVRELLISPQTEEASYRKRAEELSRIALGPAAAQLGGKRLLIVASGILQYVPFAALPEPGSTGGEPLIVGHEIVNLPSASVLAVLRRENANRQPAAKTVAVLADPVFGADDPRVKGGVAARRSPPPRTRDEAALADYERAVRDVTTAPLSRLAFSRQEAQAILAASPKGAGLIALDFQASREKAVSGELSEYRIVHFATHGLLDSVHPELSGLVFSLVDRQGRAQDGYLRLHEIYNLRLSADVVVLSACRTGLGKEVKGEGLVGLTRGFMYAGAPRVVASLWRVDDVATAELMQRFYRGMLRGGLRPAAALRAAQIEMWRKKQWQSPFYWGAFVLQGEWK